jgi:uncharacterized DUF497 family protein
MIDLRFEWDEAKASSNLRAHRVSFDVATTVFDDLSAIERIDLRDDYGEERLIIVGTARDGLVLVVVYTEREDRIRIISARRATSGEEQEYLKQKA